MNSFRLSGCGLRGDVLGRNHRALDHEDVEPGVHDDLRVPLDPLGCERRCRDDAGLLDLADPAGEQLLLERLAVELLHPPGGLLVGERRDLLVDGFGVLVARPQALEVQAGEASETTDLGRGGRRDRRVHGRGHHRQRERVGVDLPGDVDVVGVARPPRRHDRHLIEPVRPPRGLPLADLDLHPCLPRTDPDMQRRPPASGWAPSLHTGHGITRPGPPRALARTRIRVETRVRGAVHLTLTDPSSWSSVGTGPSGALSQTVRLCPRRRRTT